MKEIVLWATKKGAPKWQEQLITSTTDAKRLASARVWAIENGFDRLRESVLDLSTPPNFAGTLNKVQS